MEAVYLDAAREEGLVAANWYEEQSDGLKLRFLSEWRRAEMRMLAAPLLNRSSKDGIRLCRFEVFPYSLIYRIQAAGILEVIAVMHSSRKPGYWRRRLGPPP